MAPPEGVAERRKSTLFEQHAQTALTVLLVGLLGWVGMATQSTQVEVAKLSVDVENLKDVIRTPEPRVNDLTRRIEILEEHVLTEDHAHERNN